MKLESWDTRSTMFTQPSNSVTTCRRYVCFFHVRTRLLWRAGQLFLFHYTCNGLKATPSFISVTTCTLCYEKGIISLIICIYATVLYGQRYWKLLISLRMMLYSALFSIIACSCYQVPSSFMYSWGRVKHVLPWCLRSLEKVVCFNFSPLEINIKPRKTDKIHVRK